MIVILSIAIVLLSIVILKLNSEIKEKTHYRGSTIEGIKSSIKYTEKDGSDLREVNHKIRSDIRDLKSRVNKLEILFDNTKEQKALKAQQHLVEANHILKTIGDK